MCAAVLLPARFVRFVAERLFLAVADGLDVPRRNSCLGQRVARRASAAVAQSKVVFRGATLVTVSLDRDLPIRMLLQERRIRGELLLRIRTDSVGVVIEEDVLHVRREQLVVGLRGLRLDRRSL